MRKPLRWYFVALTWLQWGCQSGSPAHPPGIALSFDDRFINEWYELRPLFQRHQARATFYVTAFDSLSTAERAQLKTLQHDGHEIGCHGAIHTNSVQYVQNHSMQAYLDAEISPALRSMRRAGFRPTSFAHPGGTHNRAIDKSLLKQFVLLRDVALVQRTIWGITLRWNVELMPTIYNHFDGDQTVDALLIDDGSGLHWHDLQRALQKAKQEGTVLMLFGHKPYRRPVHPNEYGFSVSRLDSLLAECQRLGLRTYTMSDLVTLSPKQ